MSSRAWWTGGAVVLFAGVFMFVAFAGIGGIAVLQGGIAAYASQPNPSCGTTLPDGVSVDGLSVEQVGNASLIVGKGKELGLPRRAWQIAVAVAMQESTLINVGYGDTAGPDSAGLFQQRDSWGPYEVRTDPVGAAGLFYARLVAIPGWEALPLWTAAQLVQRSAFPFAYQRWEGFADQVVAKVEGTATTGCASGTVIDGYALPLPADRMTRPAPEHHDFPAVDFSTPVGTPVYAVTPGVATLLDSDPGGCGAGIQVVNGDQVWLYCHLSARFVAGSPVAAGVQVGLSGGAVGSPGAGSSTGPHLHVQLRLPGANGRLVCVQRVFDELGEGRPAPDPVGLRTVWPCLVD